MKKVLILGGGTAGTIMANKMLKELPVNEWSVTVIEKTTNHYYQPGFLFIPFGLYQKKDILKPVTKFIPKGVKVINIEVEKIDPEKNIITLINGTEIDYDILIIATGTRISPEDTPG